MERVTDWRTYAMVALLDLSAWARTSGWPYLPVRCPQCGRLRLQPEEHEPVCEKCDWRPSHMLTVGMFDQLVRWTDRDTVEGPLPWKHGT